MKLQGNQLMGDDDLSMGRNKVSLEPEISDRVDAARLQEVKGVRLRVLRCYTVPVRSYNPPLPSQARRRVPLQAPDPSAVHLQLPRPHRHGRDRGGRRVEAGDPPLRAQQRGECAPSRRVWGRLGCLLFPVW